MSERIGGLHGLLTAGANFHASQINVGLYPRIGRTPIGVTTRANAQVTNGAGYVQDAMTLLKGKLQLSGGVRYDVFHFNVRDRVAPENSGVDTAGRWQPKFNAAYTPFRATPFTLHFNYGRGVTSLDARSIIQQPGGQRVANTDFYQAEATKPPSVSRSRITVYFMTLSLFALSSYCGQLRPSHTYSLPRTRTTY